MKYVPCPHCKAHRIHTTGMPKDVIVVMPCPKCHEWVVLFRRRAMAVDRRILQEGSLEEQSQHLAPIIAQFLKLGAFFLAEDAPEAEENSRGDKAEAPAKSQGQEPITDREIQDFIQVDLNQIDDSTYFRKHFG